MTTFLNGLSLASVLALVAIGLAIIFGLMRVVNLAHGEMFVLGSYSVLALYQATGSLWWGVAAAPFVVGAAGWLIERSVIRPLYRRPLDTLVATWGLSIVIRELLKIVFGGGSRNLPLPITATVRIGSTTYPGYRIFLILLAVSVIGLVLWVFLRTEFGLRVRAVIQDREVASAMGIDASGVDQVVFALGAALAGFAGAVMTPLVTLNPNVGLFFLAQSFLVVIAGGVGSLLGTVVGAVVIGMGSAVISVLTRPVVAEVTLFVLAIFLIRLRPTGLLGGSR